MGQPSLSLVRVELFIEPQPPGFMPFSYKAAASKYFPPAQSPRYVWGHECFEHQAGAQ
jgi:hypothetical protein